MPARPYIQETTAHVPNWSLLAPVARTTLRLATELPLAACHNKSPVKQSESRMRGGLEIALAVAQRPQSAPPSGW